MDQGVVSGSSDLDLYADEAMPTTVRDPYVADRARAMGGPEVEELALPLLHPRAPEA
jgi:hypothetical protein